VSLARRAWTSVGHWYSVALVLLAWEAIARSGLVNPRLFPDLGQIADQFVGLLRSTTFYGQVGTTLFRVLSGFLGAAVVGIPLGFLLGRGGLFSRLFEPLFSFGYPVPRIALYPVFLFAFGLGHGSKISMIFLECLYPIAVNTYYGTRAVNQLYVWSGQNMGASPRQLFFKVVVPATAPAIFAGLRIALPIALIIAVLTEMVGATEGLGYLISVASASFQRAQVFAMLAVIAIIGFVFDRSMATLRERLVFWDRRSAPTGGLW
jgi:NitT/TauT family transport system permease protein